MSLTAEQLLEINATLRDKSPQEIIQWAQSLGKRLMATTSFSPNAGAMLHLVTSVDKGIPVVWVDSGYNVPDTYRVAEQLIQRLQPNLQVFIPQMTAARRDAILGGIPMPDEDPAVHEEFTRQVKLEPFQRAIAEIQPEVWITGIRREETEFRKTLDIVSVDNRGLIKVAPIFYWRELDVEAYMQQHELPSCRHYFDPTKVADNRECGLHTSA